MRKMQAEKVTFRGYLEKVELKDVKMIWLFSLGVFHYTDNLYDFHGNI